MLHVYVEDVDAAYERAKTAGGTSIMPPRNRAEPTTGETRRFSSERSQSEPGRDLGASSFFFEAPLSSFRIQSSSWRSASSFMRP